MNHRIHSCLLILLGIVAGVSIIALALKSSRRGDPTVERQLSALEIAMHARIPDELAQNHGNHVQASLRSFEIMSQLKVKVSEDLLLRFGPSKCVIELRSSGGGAELREVLCAPTALILTAKEMKDWIEKWLDENLRGEIRDELGRELAAWAEQDPPGYVGDLGARLDSRTVLGMTIRGYRMTGDRTYTVMFWIIGD